MIALHKLARQQLPSTYSLFPPMAYHDGPASMKAHILILIKLSSFTEMRMRLDWILDFPFGEAYLSLRCATQE